MLFEPTAIPDVILVTPRVFEDERGFLFETWRDDLFAEAGIAARFVQDNHTLSHRGVLRGLHYQIHKAQGKLVRVVVGEIYDVAVDLRLGSPSFGRWVGMHLSAASHQQLWIPSGFAHGFVVLSEQAEVLYRCTDTYAPEHQRAIRYDDPELGVAWPLEAAGKVLVAPKDDQAPSFAAARAELEALNDAG